ncbi:hypothetical protein K488DRAFT_70803 [Vararia minispora EC-137]|uniref:Uncharacterized protein n=1 Tax=Vararia minispora EC-137 TaxID=1314806 RepID=A0ACB8QKK7_9AGAM|nr:hypothetical protein K488DRAFT_70803 [Vararia minispora EC-137]
MAPTALQARIAAFEALNNGDPSSLKSLVVDSDDPPSSPTSTRGPGPGQASVIDLKDWVIEDRPSSSSSSTSRAHRSSPSSRPTVPARTVLNPPPLIQVGSPPRPPSSSSSRRAPAVPLPTITAAVAAPPLPPRKSSSPTSAGRSIQLPRTSPASPPASPNLLTLPESDHSYPPPGSRLGRGHGQASSISSFHSVSLSSDGGSGNDPASPHVQTFPIDHDEHGNEPDADADSLADSFEDVSTPSSYVANTPTLPSALLKSKPPLKPKPGSRIPPPAPIPIPVLTQPIPPPRLPQRGSSGPKQPTTPSSPMPTSYTRRVPPPPPPPIPGPLPYAPRQRARSGSRPPSVRSSIQSTSTIATTVSDRSSVLSRTTSLSSLSHPTTPSPKPTPRTRLAPIPPPARARYDALFVANARPRIRAQRRVHLTVPAQGPSKRRANAGWRGLSIDLIPADNAALLEDAARDAAVMKKEEQEDEVDVPPDARLAPAVVKRIWALSRLDKARLREIWDECLDPARAKEQKADGLDREAFARGMWRIDEELKRARAGAGARGSKVQRRAR